MVEAQACGTPVIAYRPGRRARHPARPVPPAPTGLFFAEQSAASIVAAVERFEALSPAIAAADCQANARRFSRERFRDAMRRVVAQHLPARPPCSSR